MWFSGFFFLILSLIVEVYLWYKLQASLIFLSGRTCTIGGWLNTFLPHCMFRYLYWKNRDKNTESNHFLLQYKSCIVYNFFFWPSKNIRNLNMQKFHRIHPILPLVILSVCPDFRWRSKTRRSPSWSRLAALEVSVRHIEAMTVNNYTPIRVNDRFVM